MTWNSQLRDAPLCSRTAPYPETKEGAERGLMFRWYALLLNNALLPSWLVKATIPSPRMSPPSLAASCVWSRDFQIPLIPETKELTPGTAGSRQDCAQAPGFKCLLRLSTLGVWGQEEAGFGDFLLLLLFSPADFCFSILDIYVLAN